MTTTEHPAQVDTPALSDSDWAQYAHALEQELHLLTYAISHDLRAPLRHIDGYTRRLQEQLQGSDHSESLKLADRLQTANNRLQRYVNSLLEYRHIGTVALRIQDIETQACLEGMLSCFGRYPSGKVWQATLAGTLPRIGSDEALFSQLCYQLIDNAYHYSAWAETPRLEIVGEVSGDRLLLSFADNGVGFDPERSQQLFQLFRSVHTAREVPYHGVGAGLALARRIAERLGATLSAASEPGRSAIFRVELPLQLELQAALPGRHHTAAQRQNGNWQQH
ncbi:MAG: hypothetical protein OHK0039_16530 [Bacteroidia bacterium]